MGWNSACQLIEAEVEPPQAALAQLRGDRAAEAVVAEKPAGPDGLSEARTPCPVVRKSVRAWALRSGAPAHRSMNLKVPSSGGIVDDNRFDERTLHQGKEIASGEGGEGETG